MYYKYNNRQQIAIIGGCIIILAAFIPIFWYYFSRVYSITLENYNEGWNAIFVDRIQQGKTLYPGSDELLLNNYPPLSFFIISWLTKFGGNAIVVGRLTSSISFTIAMISIYLIVCYRTNLLSGVFAASCFGLLFACFPGQRIGLNDPQLLAHAFMLIGLVTIWIAPNRAWIVVAAAIAMVLVES